MTKSHSRVDTDWLYLLILATGGCLIHKRAGNSSPCGPSWYNCVIEQALRTMKEEVHGRRNWRTIASIFYRACVTSFRIRGYGPKDLVASDRGSKVDCTSQWPRLLDCMGCQGFIASTKNPHHPTEPKVSLAADGMSKCYDNVTSILHHHSGY